MGLSIALLRAINVGGRNRVAMQDLLDLLASLGLAGGRALLQSGNLVFDDGGHSPAELERLLERETAARLNLHVDFLVRSAEEWAAIVAANPFPAEAVRDPSRVVLMPLKDEPSPGAITALSAAIRGPEQVRAEGRQLYLHYPDGIGRSKLTGALIETRLGTRGTARNWNTVRSLADLVC
jgi:uncharacterized protein (DUF1697 family)